MQDTLLRVFVVALGLLTCPRKDDPGVEEYDEVASVAVLKHNERLLTEERLDHETAPVSEEMTHADNRGSQENVKNIQSDQHVPEKDVSVLEDVTVIHQDSEEDVTDDNSPGGGHFIAYLDPSWPQNSQSDSALKTLETDHEQNAYLHLDKKSKEGKHTMTSENETSEAIADWEGDCLLFIWNALSIISVIRFFRKYFGKESKIKGEETKAVAAADVRLPDSETLHRFHSKCIKVSSGTRWKEFLEGFANDLMEAMRNVCNSNGGMVIEHFQIVDVCNIIVPFTPPDPYSFRCELMDNQASDLLPDMQVRGQIRLVENQKIQNGCHCQSPDLDDMVCLLHCKTEKVKREMKDVCDGLLCMKNSPFLSKTQVTRWFQSTIRRAWEQISHKYEFELNIRCIGAPGALIVRFRSGKKICFNFTPVVKVNADAHCFITHCSPDNFDTSWTLCLTNYEELFLDHISKHLPENSCHIQTLEIAVFLHKRQTALSGSSALKDFHFKIALMHLLLTKNPSEWEPKSVALRLRDLLAFMERSLKKKLLNHVLIGNPLKQRVIELPVEFTHAERVNLLYPLVVHDCIYRNAVTHFKEILTNADMLIHDYVETANSIILMSQQLSKI